MKLYTLRCRNLASITLCMLASHLCQAQLHSPDYPQNKWLFATEDQYQHGFYAMAAQSAQYYLHTQVGNTIRPFSIEVDKAKYYYTVSSLKIGAVNCADSAVAYIATTGNPSYKQRTAYALAQYYFHHNDFSTAIRYYELAGIANLSNRELVDKNFELAYCYFNTMQFDKATSLFASIKELTTGKYFLPGNYYYGLLAYNTNQYEEALKSFDRIKDDAQYKSIVPYYIAEIYYFTGKREKALQYAKELMSRPEKLYYDNELHLLAAQCLFEGQQFAQAIPYFEFYYDNTEKIRKEDLYEMAYCYYRTNNFSQATDKFKLLSNTKDSLGQTAMYLLGDCYLKNGDKRSARNAFGICADMSFNPAQQEAATILYAKLSYEMGYNDDAATALRNLLTGFPDSKFTGEAKTLLADLLIKTNNYEAAYKNMSGITDRPDSYWRVYQKVAFGYGIKQMEAGNYSMADSLLQQSLLQPQDPAYTSAAYFWRGELAYRAHRYDQVINFDQSFLDKKVNTTTVVSPQATVQHARITMGYAAMQLNQYKDAQNYFAGARQGGSSTDAASTVASIQEADAVFMQRDYAKAATLYDQVTNSNSLDADYARYQKSIVLGLQGNNNDKIALLQALINKRPASSYQNKARYELAITYIAVNKYQEAIDQLKQLTSAANATNLAPQAWMKEGFAYQQLNNNDKAIDAYKHIISDYPNADERAAALDALKSIYIESNQPGAYTALLQQYNLPTDGTQSIDSTYYSAAEVQYASSNWAAAVTAMGNYLKQYPTGAFAVKAHYYKAESNYQLKNYKEALPDYDSVLAYPWSDFSENSARRAATIAFDLHDYTAALAYFQKLRNVAMSKDNLQLAYNGLMQSSYNTEQYNEAQRYADTLLTLPDVAEPIVTNALLFKAKALQHYNNNDSAMAVYQQLQDNKNGAIAAEARYHISEIYLAEGKLKEAETAANNTIKQSGGYEYWVVKSYLVLADLLVKQKDYFNARATLESIVKHTSIAELKQEASRKLEEVKKTENQHSKLSE